MRNYHHALRERKPNLTQQRRRFRSLPPSPLSGLSDSTVNNLSGMFMEDVEVSSVNDVGGLVERLEEALKEAGGEVEDLDEEEIRKKQEELDDGW